MKTKMMMSLLTLMPATKVVADDVVKVFNLDESGQ